MKLKKVGISLESAYAYVLLGSLTNPRPRLGGQFQALSLVYPERWEDHHFVLS